MQAKIVVIDQKVNHRIKVPLVKLLIVFQLQKVKFDHEIALYDVPEY